jgi:hypothetical protein
MEDKYYKYDQLSIHKEALIMKIAKTIAISMFVGMLLLVFGCKKEDDGEGPGYGAVDIQMTGAVKADNAEFLAVNVDIQSVQLHYTGADSVKGWVTVATNAGIYNLLNFKEYSANIIARSNELDPGKVTQMRLILGERNSVIRILANPESATQDTVAFPMELSSQANTGLKLNLHNQIAGGKSMIVTLDFDAHQSIVQEGTGTYKLNPVIAIKSIAYR